MIRYALRCACGHGFDGWFRSNADFETQVDRSLLICPVCGGQDVEKALMAPSVTGTKKTVSGPVSQDVQPSAEAPPPKPQPTQEVIAPDPRMKAMVAMMRAIKAHVEKTADHVGKRFPEEARKIHYGEAEPRGIYGEATVEDARALTEEGIEILPMPVLPEDRN